MCVARGAANAWDGGGEQISNMAHGQPDKAALFRQFEREFEQQKLSSSYLKRCIGLCRLVGPRGAQTHWS
jgi:hypothetical protein